MVGVTVGNAVVGGMVGVPVIGFVVGGFVSTTSVMGCLVRVLDSIGADEIIGASNVVGADDIGTKVVDGDFVGLYVVGAGVVVGSIDVIGILLGGEVGTFDVIIIEFGATVVLIVLFVGSSSVIMTADIGQQVISAFFSAAQAALDAS